MAASHRQAAMMKDRLEEQFAWRKEQLEREIAALMQRKSAIIAQMGSLQQLAAEAVTGFDAAVGDTDLPDRTDEHWLASSQRPAPAEGRNEPTTVLADLRSAPAAGAPQQAREAQGSTIVHPAAEQQPEAAEPNPAAPEQVGKASEPADAEPTTVINVDEPTKIIGRVEGA